MEQHQATANTLSYFYFSAVLIFPTEKMKLFFIKECLGTSGQILGNLTPFAERFQTLLNKIGWKSGQQKTPAFTGV